MAPRAILLDALGTLITLEDPAPTLAGLLRERHAIEVGAADAGRALRAEMRFYREHCIGASDAQRLAALRLECAQLVARELGAPAAKLAPQELLPTLLDSLRFAAFPEVPAALDRWRAAGARLVVASNWDVSLHDVLRQTGLSERLDGAVTSAEVGAAKPSRELFAAALAVAGVEASQATHIGDSLIEDVEGATAAGIAAVWLRRAGTAQGGAPAPDVRVIETLEDFQVLAGAPPPAAG